MSQAAHQTFDLRPALILFGNDQSGRLHAGWFTAEELVAAERASGAQGYVALRLTSEEEQALARQFPRGRVAQDRAVDLSALSPELFRALRNLIQEDQSCSSTGQQASRPGTPPPRSSKGFVRLSG